MWRKVVNTCIYAQGLIEGDGLREGEYLQLSKNAAASVSLAVARSQRENELRNADHN